MRLYCIVFVMCCCVIISCDRPAGITGVVQSTTASTSDRIRVVWLQGGDPEMGGGMMLGYDSKNDGTHCILKQDPGMRPDWPRLCSKGGSVVFTNTFNLAHYKTYIVKWNGTDIRFISDGGCSGVWNDTVRGREWAIIRTGGNSTSGSIILVDINQPSNRDTVWDSLPAGSTHSGVWYSISGDGHKAVDCFPFGSNSLVVTDGGWCKNGQAWKAPTFGCWYSMAPDNSYYWFHFYYAGNLGGHSGFYLYKDTVALGTVELRSRGVNEEHFHLKFSANSARHVV